MTPINIDGCFAWLHLPKSQRKSTAVVVCPGLNVDEVTGYSSQRLLAEALAGQGYPVLRLHYIGTGNSPNLDGSFDHWAVWQANIERSIDWLRQNCNVEHVVLCGLRFGGMLASIVAARRSDVNGLILLSPVLRGRSYMRQYQSDGFVNVGAKLSRRTVEMISGTDLRTVVPTPGCKIILFAQSAGSVRVSECVDGWRAAGAAVTVSEFVGLEPMLRPTFVNHRTPVTTEPIVAWMGKTFPERSSARADLCLMPVQIDSQQWVETPLFFGADHKLFGILCRPHREATGCIVIMGNSSAEPHCAANTVELARQLAAKGVPSLRLDFSGVGDSPSASGVGSHIFETDRTEDFFAAVNVLQRLGFTRFATEGLCSGAYHAYHAALGDSRVGYAFMINMPCFDWVPGFPVEDLVLHTRKTSELLPEMRSLAFWLCQWNKIVRGDFRFIGNRFVWLGRKLRRVLDFGRAHGSVQGPSRQVKMLFFVSEGDVSRDIVRHAFGSRGASSNVTMDLVDGLDHSLHHREMCATIAGRISAFLDADQPLSICPPQDAIADLDANCGGVRMLELSGRSCLMCSACPSDPLTSGWA